MDANKLNAYMASASKYFTAGALSTIKQQLEQKDDETLMTLYAVEYKDPTTMLIVSVLIGTLGIDRIMVGDVRLGVAKLLTAGGCGIWTIVDWFLIQDIVRQKNLEKFNSTLAYL